MAINRAHFLNLEKDRDWLIKVALGTSKCNFNQQHVKDATINESGVHLEIGYCSRGCENTEHVLVKWEDLEL